jgi:cytochrome oxidase Cu insertion factor (SCO1/SenC/PrrC family)
VSTNQPQVAARRRQPVPVRVRWALWAAALVIGVGVGAVIKLSRAHSPSVSSGQSAAVQTWAAGVRPAPSFSLVDQKGKPFSLASFHGRPVIVTFIDPLCRDFCPREASILSQAATEFGPAKPVIVSVSVDPWADTAANFHEDALHWQLAPGWRWGVGSEPKLAAVWKSYGIAMVVTRKKIAGISVRYITHTGAAYLIDGSGFERALFLYPFNTKDIVGAARSVLKT